MTGKGLVGAAGAALVFLVVAFSGIGIWKWIRDYILLENQWLLLSFYILLVILLLSIAFYAKKKLQRKTKNTTFYGPIIISIYVVFKAILLIYDFFIPSVYHTGSCEILHEHTDAGRWPHSNYYLIIMKDTEKEEKIEIPEYRYRDLGGKTHRPKIGAGSYKNEDKCNKLIRLKYLQNSHFIQELTTY